MSESEHYLNSDILDEIPNPAFPPEDDLFRMLDEIDLQPESLWEVSLEDVQNGLLYMGINQKRDDGLNIRNSVKKIVDLVDEHLSLFAERLTVDQISQLAKRLKAKYQTITNWSCRKNGETRIQHIREVIRGIELNQINDFSILAALAKPNIEDQCKKQYSNKITFMRKPCGKRKRLSDRLTTGQQTPLYLTVENKPDVQPKSLWNVSFEDVQKGLLYMGINQKRDDGLTIQNSIEKIVDLVDDHLSLFSERLTEKQICELTNKLAVKYATINEWPCRKNAESRINKIDEVTQKIKSHQINDFSILAAMVKPEIKDQCKKQYSNKIEFPYKPTRNKRKRRSSDAINWSKIRLTDKQRALLYVAVDAETKKCLDLSRAINNVVNTIKGHLSEQAAQVCEINDELQRGYYARYQSICHYIQHHSKINELITTLRNEPDIDLSSLAHPINEQFQKTRVSNSFLFISYEPTLAVGPLPSDFSQPLGT